jgi:hypothetical protein
MALPKLALRNDERTFAWKGFVAILANDPRLKAAGVEWHSWTGKPDDAAEPSGVSPSTPIPIWIRLTPEPDSAAWGPVQTTVSPMLIKVEIAVNGTDVTDSMSVWRAIEHALYGKPGDAVGQAAALAAVHGAGISSVDVIKPAWGNKVADEVNRQRSEGWLRLLVYVPTPGLN